MQSGMQKALATASVVSLLSIALPVAALSVSDIVRSGTHVEDAAQTAVDVSASSGGTLNADTNLDARATLGAEGSSSDASSDASASVSDSDSVFPIFFTRSDVNLEGTTTAQVPNPMTVSTNADLSSYISSEIAADPNLQKVQATDDALSVTYKIPAKLFGIIPVSVNATALVDSSGTVNVTYPWYVFLVSTDRADLESRVQSRVDSVLNAGANADLSAGATATATASTYATANAASAMSAPIRAQLISEIRMAMQAEASASAEASLKTN